ncbi:MAG: class I SAM-dependent rRNA methyltransferase [Siphonobacter sp.]
MLAEIILKPGKDAPLRRFHPWVFSGAIDKTLGKPKDGDVVNVLDHQKNYLATGHFHEGSITVKLFAFQPVTPDASFWHEKLEKALRVRQALQFTTTNCYRLVHGEGDGLPGLILDWYNGVVVFQAHSVGMHREREGITKALQQLYDDTLVGVYDKSHETLPDRYAQSVQNGYLWQKHEIALPHSVLENNHTFLIDWQTGQKTGFFLDQRENRQLLSKYVAGKRVLNAFCYSGGFSIYALAAQATLVHSVDVSEKAIRLVEKNVEVNFESAAITHEAYAEDVVKYLKSHDQQYDVVVLDPPAYAKSMDARHRAVQGYKRLNIEGLKRLAPGGILFTFSCSQVVDRELFYNTIVAAAIEAGRQVRVLHHLSQGPDHPVNFFHPEGHYLKGLVLYVE